MQPQTSQLAQRLGIVESREKTPFCVNGKYIGGWRRSGVTIPVFLLWFKSWQLQIAGINQGIEFYKLSFHKKFCKGCLNSGSPWGGAGCFQTQQPDCLAKIYNKYTESETSTAAIGEKRILL